MTRLALTAVILSAVALPARGQSSRASAPSPETTTISGRVVADRTGAPLPNVRITVTAVPPGAPVVLTDADGRFSLLAPVGPHSLVASKSAYARSELTPTTVGRPIEIRLRRGAAISGRVIDDAGEPVLGAPVSAEAVSTSPRRFTTVATTSTDDRGEYRLASLPTGSFAVAVSTFTMTREVQGDQVTVRPIMQKMYYPRSSQAEAEDMRLEPGDDRSGIDFVVPTDQSGYQPFSAVRAAGVSPLNRAQDPAARATGNARGRIVSSDGSALPYAQVVLTSQGMEPRIVRADDAGRFEFLELPAGTFRVLASKLGYFPITAGEPSSPSVDLAEDEKRDGIEVSLVRWGTLTGRVFDEYGDPVQGVSIQLLQVWYEAGRRRLVPVGPAARLTNDVGAYRLFGLSPGRYIVSAAIGDVTSADVPGYGGTYFPGTPTPAEAQFVSIGPAPDVAGIDIALSRTHTARVVGQVLNAAGEPTTGGSLMLMTSQQSASVTSVPVGARVLPNGTFEFANVPPGQYVIQAYRGRSNPWTEGEFGALPVGVGDADVTDLVLQMSSGSSIAGHLSFDTIDPSKQPSPSGIELSPIPVGVDLSPPNPLATANIHSNGSFEIAGISGSRRLQLLRAPPGWALKEIRVNDIDITDRPLPFGQSDQSLTRVDVVLTDRVSELNGTIRDDNSRPVPGSSLIVFSTDRGQWYPASRFLRTTVAAADGGFALTGLPSGTYYAVAVAKLPPEGEDAWQAPDFLDALIPRASTVSVADGQQLSLSVRVAADAPSGRP